MRYWYRLLAQLKARPELWLLPLLALAFFLATSWYNWQGQQGGFVKWASPDETANYQLAKQYAVNGKLWFLEKYNLVADGIIQPRSLRSDGALLKPVSFLGLPLLYGRLAAWTSVDYLPYFTPAVAALGLIFYFLLLKRLFGRGVAAVATVLLAVFPVYLYFSAHSFFHNTLFVVLLIIFLYFATLAGDCSPWRQAGEGRAEISRHYLSWLWAALAGAALGWAIATRTSELLWLGPTLVLLWLFNARRLGLWRLLIIAYFALLSYSPVLYWNTVLYGAPLASGYPHMDTSVQTIVSSSTNLVASTVIKQNLSVAGQYASALYDAFFYFGFKPGHSYKMAYQYLYSMFTWLVYLAIVGFIVFIFRFKDRRKGDLAYILALALWSAILIAYYGSWIFYDNPDPNAYTIGNSYTRYWLPIYLGLLPLAAMALLKLSRLVIKPRLRVWLLTLLIALIAVPSLLFTAFGSEEGLVYSLDRLKISKGEYERVLAKTEPDSVLITRYHDKLFFPERHVIVGLLTDQEMNKRYAILAKKVPVYYYNFSFSERDFNYLNQGKLKELGLKLEKVAKITEKFTLYRLSRQ